MLFTGTRTKAPLPSGTCMPENIDENFESLTSTDSAVSESISLKTDLNSYADHQNLDPCHCSKKYNVF